MFKIRCSAIGQIMTNPRSKSELISKTTITYLETWQKERLYNRRKSFTSKYTDKGTQQESWAIDFLADQTNRFLAKNETHFNNEWITGTPDIVLSDTIIDIKCSWDPFTFPLFDSEPDKAYWWQLQGYMDICDRERAELTYILADHTDEEIDRECKRRSYALGMDGDVTIELYDAVQKELTYDDIPNDLRIKTFSFNRDQKAIDAIHERVEVCREYIKTHLSHYEG